jgi:hypothetical protein
MNTIETWIVAHQAFLLLLWPIVTAAASLICKVLDETSRGHAFLSTLAGLGVDIPKIIDAIGRLISPPPPPPGGNSTDNSDDKTEPRMKPPASHRQRFAMVAALSLALASLTVGGFAAATSGCKNFNPQPPPNTPADVTGAIDCVTTALLSNGDIGQCILTYGPALIADAIQTLLHSQFAKDHPELTPIMKDRLLTVKRQIDAGVVQ